MFDPGRLRDPALRPIAEKVHEGARLLAADARILYSTSDLTGLGRLADMANQRRNGERVYFSANQHINPTNICVLRNTCTFCSFARMPKEAGGYTRTLEEVFAEAEQARGMPTKEFHIVGGLHPKLRLSYYTDMIRGLKQRFPEVHIKALTAVEIAHLARIEKTSERDVLIAMKEAGLTSLPGGGAEVFSTAVRATIAERKLTGQEWLRVHRVAHELGIPSNCTMLYGHVETMDDRIKEAVNLIKGNNEQWIAWCGLNDEADEIADKIGKDARNLSGDDDPEEKANTIIGFTKGEYRVLVTKPKIAGMGLNLQNCRNQVFIGLSDSYRDYYQCIRRSWRYGQTKPVNIWIILSDLESQIAANVRRKEIDAERMGKEMVKRMSDLEKEEVIGTRREETTCKRKEVKGENWRMVLGD
jgi:aminodeoxyfutalosine synthase